MTTSLVLKGSESTEMVVAFETDIHMTCATCNCDVLRVYVTEATLDGASQFFYQEGGLCSECFLGELIQDGSVELVTL